jgi:hypothetical protein
MDIDDDYVLCSEDYYEKNRDQLQNRRRILSCRLSIYDRDGMDEERKIFYGKRFGHGHTSGNDFGIEISLRHEVFESLVKHIDSGRKITRLNISFKSTSKINPSVSGSGSDFHTIWKTSEEEFVLSVEVFSVEVDLYETKKSWEIEDDKRKQEQIETQKKQELMEIIENAITQSDQKTREEIVGKLFKEFKPYLTLITMLLGAIVLSLIYK